MMENMKGFDRMALINELVQGMEYAKELRNQFSNPKTNNSCSSSIILNDDDANQALSYSLLEKMLASFDKTINIATSIANNSSQMDIPNNNSCSPKSSGNSHLFDVHPSKKRKSMMPKWSKSVQVSNGGVISGLEGALNDGFSWRKYGQKDILGAKFPRGYYRCTHRHSRGCAATKQVQRSNEDPTIYQIMYKGEHTCAKEAHFSQPNCEARMKSEPQPPPSPQQQQEVYLGFGPEGELKVEPELQDTDYWAQMFDPISFTSAYTEPDPMDNMLSFSPSFGSPATSGSNCLPVSPYRPMGAHIGLTVQTSETDNNEVVSGPNSVTNSPIVGDFEFPLDDLLLDVGSYFSHNFDF